jgi:putative transposase
MPKSSRGVRAVLGVFIDLLRFVPSGFTSRTRLGAENLFLRKQLALYVERRVKPRRPDDATRIMLVVLSQFIDWRRVLTVVQPATLIRWHRKGFGLFWTWKSRPRGRPRVPVTVQRLIADMAKANLTWGESELPPNSS